MLCIVVPRRLDHNFGAAKIVIVYVMFASIGYVEQNLRNG